MKKRSVGFSQGKGSLRHNNRDFIHDNVDRDRIKDNITYKKESLEQAYEKCFGKAIGDYNARQKRADRKIDGVKGYINQIKKSKNGEKLFYEAVVQVGNMSDCKVGTADGEIAKKILDNYMKDFQKRNPNLYVFNAVMHLDEQTPHLHIDYIPCAHNYKQGLSVRNSLDKSLKEQGVSGGNTRYDNRTISWQNAEKDHIEQIMREYGYERTPETGLHRQHMSVEQYKLSAEKAKQEARKLPKQIETAPFAMNKNRVSVNKNDLEKLEERARLSIVHEKSISQALEGANKAREEAQAMRNALESQKREYEAYTCSQAVKNEQLYREYTFAKEKYEKKFSEQEALNNKYEQVLKENESLRTENIHFRSKIAYFDEEKRKAVETATAPLIEQNKAFRDRIKDLEERLDGMCQSITNVTKAVNMLLYDKQQGYFVNLTTKQKSLIKGIEKYVKKFLRIEGKEDMAKDIEKNIGISKGINDAISSIQKEKFDLEH